MSFSAITVLILIVCNSNIVAVPQDDNSYIQNTGPHIYQDLNGEDTYIDPSPQEYYQSTTQATKLARDDINFVANLAQSATGNNANFAQATAGFATGHANTFTLNGLGSLDSAASSLFGNGGSGGGYSFAASGGSGFTHGASPTSFGHGGGTNFAGHGGTNIFNSGGSYGGSSGGSDGGYNHLPPVIHKSVYVHIAPPEEEVPKQKVIIPKVPPKKNYQIVFIKAPTPPPPSAPVIPPFPPQSDKTLIYVLHPKPEEAPPIHIPAPPQNNPVKPEVYFIRYKTKKEEDGYHRRYGRDGEEEEEEEGESLDTTDSATRSVPQESEVPVNQYEEQSDTDSSGESSNIIHVYTTERGKNAH